jgi:hypothetical protein
VSLREKHLASSAFVLDAQLDERFTDAVLALPREVAGGNVTQRQEQR